MKIIYTTIFSSILILIVLFTPSFSYAQNQNVEIYALGACEGVIRIPPRTGGGEGLPPAEDCDPRFVISCDNERLPGGVISMSAGIARLMAGTSQMVSGTPLLQRWRNNFL